MLLPPLNLTVAKVFRREGVWDVSMYIWRKMACLKGSNVRGNDGTTNHVAENNTPGSQETGSRE